MTPDNNNIQPASGDNNNQIVIYTTADGKVNLEVQIDANTGRPVEQAYIAQLKAEAKKAKGKEHLIPSEVTPEQASHKYAEEVDVLNMAMFGTTARQWREQNPDKKGNVRDYATINQLISFFPTIGSTKIFSSVKDQGLPRLFHPITPAAAKGAKP